MTDRPRGDRSTEPPQREGDLIELPTAPGLVLTLGRDVRKLYRA